MRCSCDVILTAEMDTLWTTTVSSSSSSSSSSLSAAAAKFNVSLSYVATPSGVARVYPAVNSSAILYDFLRYVMLVLCWSVNKWTQYIFNCRVYTLCPVKCHYATVMDLGKSAVRLSVRPSVTCLPLTRELSGKSDSSVSVHSTGLHDKHFEARRHHAWQRSHTKCVLTDE